MTREEFMDMVYYELHSDGDNCRADRIIDAADEYAETNQATKEIMTLLAGYIEKHPLAVECGGEYIMQDDEAQVDALELVCNIFDNM